MLFNDGIILIIVVGVVGFLVQMKLKSVFAKYSQVSMPGGLTGADVARRMLADNGITDVTITSTPGSLTDHFNPANKSVNLSESVYSASTISAAAVAAHECGHALQHNRAYAPLKLRSALVPVVQFSSSWAQIILLIGVFTLNIMPALFWVGIALFSMVLLFSLITLPVELNASSRALVWLRQSGSLNESELAQAKEALSWAALTYIVAALSALATLIYYLGFARRN